MPKREDEYWAGMKEPKGRGLCPFCGKNDRLYYSENNRSWRCGHCEKNFPSPSYGPGGDFGKEARWFGKTSEGVRGREFAEAARKARAEKRKESSRGDAEYPFHPERVGYYRGEYPSRSRKGKGLPGWLIPGLVVFLLMMFGVVVWALWGNEITEFFSGAPNTSTEEGTSPPSAKSDVSVFDGKQPPFAKTLGGERMHLVNNKDATDPTWQQLMMFLRADKTDQKDYSVFSFACGAFAEEVHNNAEAAGIKAAWVAVDFEHDSEGHALNAFNTTDKGLVFVDCTSSYRSDVVSLPTFLFDPVTGEVTRREPERPSSCDKIAYVEISNEYGLVSLDVAISPAYSFYEACLAKWEEYNSKLEAYNQEADAYNQALGGRLYLEEPEYSHFMAWYNRLNSMAAELEAILDELGDFYWESLGVVSEVKVYW